MLNFIALTFLETIKIYRVKGMISSSGGLVNIMLSVLQGNNSSAELSKSLIMG